jgi:hypothetical protein
MNRRSFLAATLAGGAYSLSPMTAADTKTSILELRLFKMRNTQDSMMQRTSEFLGKSYIPALQRAGTGPVGAFASVIGQDSPFLLMLSSYPSMAALEATLDKIKADKDYAKDREAFHSGALPYIRQEASLLRCFDTVPKIEVPAGDAKRPAKIFELRTYESNTISTLRRKIAMFNDGEIGIFRKLNMAPVFFGETLYGRNMPNLTYMLAYDDMAAREKAWSAFGKDPDWAKLRSTPGLSDAEIVSNISNSILRPLPFSQVR